MSRKTAVCLLFVFFLGFVGTAVPAQAEHGWAGVASPASSPGPTSIASAHTETGDPDGLHALSPTQPGNLLSDILRFLLSSLYL